MSADDLALRRALRRDVQALAREHPEATCESARERCAEWLSDEEHSDVIPDERKPAAAGKPLHCK